MTITPCDNTKQIPSRVKLQMYSLSATYTVDNAVADYRRRFGCEPETAWQWGSYLYVKLPEDK